MKLGAFALLLACSGRTVTPVDDADGSGSGGVPEGTSTSLPTTGSSDDTSSSSGESTTSGEVGEQPPPIDDADRPIIVRIDEGVTTWSWIGEPEHRITASAVDAGGNVLFVDHHPDMGVTLQRLDTAGSLGTISPLTGEGWAYDIAVHPEADQVVIAGNSGFALGYWLLEPELAPFVELYDAPLGEARMARVALAADGSFVIAGAHSDLETRWLKKIDAAGEIVWEDDWPFTLVTMPSLPSLADLALLPDGSIVLAIPPQDLKGPGYGIDVFDADGLGGWAWQADTTTIGGVASLGDGTFIVVGRDDASSNVALHAFVDGEEAWASTTEIIGLGPAHACGPDRVIVTPSASAFLRAHIFDAQGTLVDSPEHVERGANATADDAFCSTDGGVVIVGHVPPQ